MALYSAGSGCAAFNAACLVEILKTGLSDGNADNEYDVTEFVLSSACPTPVRRRLESTYDNDDAIYYKDLIDEEDNFFC